MFDKDFTYYGGALDRIAIFETLKSAQAYGDMFTNKKKYSIEKVTISPYLK